MTHLVNKLWVFMQKQ